MILYHCTSPQNANNILLEGFNPSKYARNDNNTYLSTYPEYCFGSTCLAVNVDNLNIVQTVNIWEYICSDIISPERITYFGYNEDED